MRRTYVPAVSAGAFMLVAGATTALAQDASRAVAGGGISLPGWAGKIDASEAGKGAKLEDAKLAKMGNDMHVTTGPAVAYWNPANKATGDYTVKAKFTESKYMGLNDHPHPYGIMIAGKESTATGWAIIPKTSRPAYSVILTYKDPDKGEVAFRVANESYSRLDVAEALKTSAALWSGWNAKFDRAAIPPGPQLISAWAFDAKTGVLYPLGTPKMID